MNYFKVQGQITARINRFLSKVITFREIDKLGNSSGYNTDLHLKDGRTAKIVCLDPGSNYISWSVDDFECRAADREGEHLLHYKYDITKFHDALDTMIRKHDASIGINWDVIDFYLDEYCMVEEVNR